MRKLVTPTLGRDPDLGGHLVVPPAGGHIQDVLHRHRVLLECKTRGSTSHFIIQPFWRVFSDGSRGRSRVQLYRSYRIDLTIPSSCFHLANGRMAGTTPTALAAIVGSRRGSAFRISTMFRNTLGSEANLSDKCAAPLSVLYPRVKPD